MQSAAEILALYQKGERPLSPDFLAAIPWSQVKNYPLSPQFIATIMYMRDVEKLTELYYQELAQTKTIHDPYIKQFMEQWRNEESLHGDLLNRFLEEAGLSSDEKWFEKAKKNIPFLHQLKSKLNPLIRSLLGTNITAVHMTWGAINEYSTINGYSRLSDLAEHPVLSHILAGIMREEARHARFYWQMARIKLLTSKRVQKISRFLLDRFWLPVGQGEKTKEDANLVIRSLYSTKDGLNIFENQVTSVIRKLPGFDGFSKTTNYLSQISQH